MNWEGTLKGKKITVMGLGLLGRGLGDARFLTEQGAELIVTDLKSAEALATSVAELTEFSNVTLVLGEHRLEDFRNRDFILKAAGVPLDSPYIAEARNEGIPIKMSASWFLELSGIKAVGVTGTRGKSTTTHMIETIYKEAGKPLLLGGNVRGVSTLALLAQATPEHTAILELDSWQLQGFGESHLSPHISVFTTFYPDHLNYYHGDLDAYLADKANIFLYQAGEDALVVGTQAAPLLTEKYGPKILSKVMPLDEHDLPSDWTLRIPGIHNRYDAALALGVARVAGISDEVSKEALEAFTGVPGRLESLGEVRGVQVYNDTTSTTPDATLAALAALEGKKVILILGGADKELNMDTLLETIPSHTKEVILLAGSGTERIRTHIPDASVFDSLEAAVAQAFAVSEPGDVILFSPAFASFGMFTNEYDRGDQFASLIQTYA